MKKFISYLFGIKLNFFLLNLFTMGVSLSTIIVLGLNILDINGELKFSTLVILIINSLFLGVKTTINILKIIIDYIYYNSKEKKVSERVRLFKELLDKEDYFRKDKNK